MANTDTQLDNVAACFFFASHIDKSTTGYQVCKDIEGVVGVGNVIGAQYLHGLYRVYLKTLDARKTLLMRGVTINGVYISCIDKNPNIVKGVNEKPALKIIIGQLPLSISNHEILTYLQKVEGVQLRTGIFEERYRDEKGGLTSFKTGRRFAYADPPEFPLPREFMVGDWRASLWHYGQKSKTHSITESLIVYPQNKPANDSTESQAIKTQPDPDVTAKLSAPDNTSAATDMTQRQSQPQHRENTPAKITSEYFSSNTNKPSRPGRSTQRGRRQNSGTRSSSKHGSGSRKRFISGNTDFPSGKSRAMCSGEFQGIPQSHKVNIDYFDFSVSESASLL